MLSLEILRETCRANLTDLPAEGETADWTASQARSLEAVSYDLALRIMDLETSEGETEEAVVARDELRHMDEHLTCWERHRHEGSTARTMREVYLARSHGARIVDILDSMHVS